VGCFEFGGISGIIGGEGSGRSGMRFWILLAALVGYHIPDVWCFLIIWKHYRPEYPGMVVYAIVSPGWLLFHSRFFIGLANAVVYGLVAYLVLLTVAKFRRA
jgi:hypothetical protein